MTAPSHPVLEFLGDTRRRGRRQAVVLGLVDFSIGAALVVLICVCSTTWSLRGDLTFPIALAASTALAGTVVLRARARWNGPLATLRSTGRAVARTPGLIGPPLPQADAASLRAARALRRDLLAATELLEAMQDAHADDTTRVGSVVLARRFADEVGYRLGRVRADPREALPGPRWRWRLFAAALTAALAVPCSLIPEFDQGAALFWTATDGRPPKPPVPLWSSLIVTIDYPDHTGRSDRRVPNPSGALRVPAGSELQIDMTLTEPAGGVTVVLIHDPPERGEAGPPQSIALAADQDGSPTGRRWSGSFEVRGGGVWAAVALDDADDSLDDGDARRSAPMPIELEPDALPEVELLPLPEDQQEASDDDTVSLRFTARDDFGLRSAELAYVLPDGELRRLPIGDAPPSSRLWRGRYKWDLSSIPIESRSEVFYWIEIRDNDPGLGLVPLTNPPGKVSSSSRQRLTVRDEEAEHAENIAGLQELRDFAVDLLAYRLTTDLFDPGSSVEAKVQQVAGLRQIHGASEALLIGISAMIDHLSMDSKVRERDVAVLAEIHERLLALHRKEADIHAKLPEGAELDRPGAIAGFIAKLSRHNVAEIRQLEDEIIRLDDLVDGQIIRSIEALTARLQASQQKMVELLEQLQAGDESVRPQIEQLQQRIREDLRRLADARQKLRKEVGEEYMNMDAFRAMEARARNQALLEQLRRGDVDEALEQARQALDETRRMRDAIQRRAGGDGEQARLSPEDEARMKLLRELSRLKDEQTTLSGETRSVHDDWRDSVSDIEAASPEDVARTAQALREKLDKVNDARLSRDGREAYQDLREALEILEAADQPLPGQGGEAQTRDAAENSGGRALELFEAADAARRALDRATRGAEKGASERKRLRAMDKTLDQLQRDLAEPLPAPAEVLDEQSRQRLQSAAQRQGTLGQQSRDLLAGEDAELLPDKGKQALEDAIEAMDDANELLRATQPRTALQREGSAGQALQRAIDSLRQGETNPPRGGGGGDASTEADQDRSLRDQVVDAMREGKSVDESTSRYYEELLR